MKSPILVLQIIISFSSFQASAQNQCSGLFHKINLIENKIKSSELNDLNLYNAQHEQIKNEINSDIRNFILENHVDSSARQYDIISIQNTLSNLLFSDPKFLNNPIQSIRRITHHSFLLSQTQSEIRRNKLDPNYTQKLNENFSQYSKIGTNYMTMNDHLVKYLDQMLTSGKIDWYINQIKLAGYSNTTPQYLNLIQWAKKPSPAIQIKKPTHQIELSNRNKLKNGIKEYLSKLFPNQSNKFKNQLVIEHLEEMYFSSPNFYTLKNNEIIKYLESDRTENSMLNQTIAGVAAKYIYENITNNNLETIKSLAGSAGYL